MKQEIARLWTKALRSGKYEQTKGSLKGNGGYCCLGVLCDISDVGKWYGNSLYVCEDDNSIGTLPREVKSWCEMNTAGGSFGPGFNESLYRLNDTGKSFSELASFIDSHWEEL